MGVDRPDPHLYNQGTKVHNFGSLQSGEDFWFLKEWFPISLVRRNVSDKNAGLESLSFGDGCQPEKNV